VPNLRGDALGLFKALGDELGAVGVVGDNGAVEVKSGSADSIAVGCAILTT
jgi:hypothetical protein